jgi:hypothetical protein
MAEQFGIQRLVQKGAVMTPEAEAGWIVLTVCTAGGFVYLVVSEYLNWRRGQRFWREIHMSAGQAVRENKRRL